MKSKKNDAEYVPIVVKLIVNLLVTFGLSLSIYLLFANVLLTVNKMQGTFLKSDHSASSLNTARNQLEEFTKKKYYDCSQSILSSEECDLINNYHDSYLNIFKLKLFENAHLDAQSLTVNTSFFTH